MKRLNGIIYFWTFLFVVSAANAQSEFALEKRAEREALWEKTAIRFPEVAEPAAALRTEAGKLRLLELSRSYVVRAAVHGRQGNFRRVKSKQHLTKACGDLASVVDLEVSEGHSFWLKFLANPIHQEGWKRIGLENKLQDLKVEALLTYRESSVPLVTPARLKQLEAELNRYFERESRQITQSGYVNLHWIGIDDLVCDLLSGNIDLKIRLIARFEAAELRRRTVLSEVQVQQLTQQMQTMPVSEQSAMNRLLSRSANLGVLLQQELGSSYDDFMTRKFHRFVGQTLNTVNGALAPMDVDVARRVSRSLDDLSEGIDTNQSIVNVSFEWNFDREEL